MATCASCAAECGCEDGFNSSGEECNCGPACSEECAERLETKLKGIPIDDYVRALAALSLEGKGT